MFINRKVQVFLFFTCVLPAGNALAQTGTIREDLSVKSTILGRSVRYAAYLPPGYESSQRSYPVLYLLHGSGGDHTGWVQSGHIQQIVDEALVKGAAPMIVIMPDGSGGSSSYFNGYQGEWRYEDFFFQEFLPHVEATFRARPSKRFRAIAGLSMGGRSAFAYALRHPDLFSSVCPLSPGAGPLVPEKAAEFYGPRGMANASARELAEYDAQYSILRLIEKIDPEQKLQLRIFIDCGDDDGLTEDNVMAHLALKRKGVAHEFRIRDGGHNWRYWRGSMPAVIEFISQEFHK